jgi:CRISPR-associated protein Csm4
MDTLQIQIQPLTAFGGSIRGDTLFGQLCWAVLHRHGESRLGELLNGYTEGKPFAVCSDAFPSGYIPRPDLPLEYYTRLPDEDPKRIKKRQWMPLDKIHEPIESWLEHCLPEKELIVGLHSATDALCLKHGQPHNSIHRGLNTTYGSEFAPYSLPQYWYASGLLLDIWLWYDPERLDMDQLTQFMADIGNFGFGRDASIGLGKYKLEAINQKGPPQQQAPNAVITLAPCAPQGMGLNTEHCYYEPFTRFGRHGDRAVLSGKPFKNPILMANTGAILSGPTVHSKGYFGQGLGGAGKLSNAIPETVHQGYAPCIDIHLKEASV